MFKMRYIIIFSIVFMLSLSLVSAEVIFSATQNLYNLQDIIPLEVTIKPIVDFNGFVELNMNCEGQIKNFYKEYLSLGVNQQKKITTSLPLTREFVIELGKCKIEAKLKDNTLYSSEFEVSDDISISFSSDKGSIKPGEEINLRGTAVKKNGKNVDGFVNFFIEDTTFDIDSTVDNGEFSANARIPDNLKSGQYAIQAYIYEKNQDGVITNQDKKSIFVTILSVPKDLKISMASVNTNPNTNLTYRPVVTDQVGDEIKDIDIIVKVRNTGGRLISEKIVSSGREDTIQIHQTADPGNWEISASYSNLSTNKGFSVNEVEEAIFFFENETLRIVNVGNVPYTKDIELDIGGEIRVIEIDEIRVGEKKTFKLYAPDGEYSIKVSDGFNEITGSMILTGDAIVIKDISSGLRYKYYLIIWIFLAFVIGLFIYSTGSKLLPGKKTYEVKENKIEEVKIDAKPEQSKEKLGNKKLSELVLPESSAPGYAEHTIVLNGQKQESNLLTLNLRNPEKKEMLPGLVKDIKQKILEKKGVLYQSNNFLFGIFAPISTKTFKNEREVLSLASEVNKMLQDYNKKFKDKVDFGLAVHSGNLILEKSGDKLKFTSSDNTMSFAKKIAELAKNEFLISENACKKAGSDIRTKKETRENIVVYHLDKIVEKVDMSRFIHDFLQRNKEHFKK